MTFFTLPTSLEVCGVEYEIRSDFRPALEICAAINSYELSDYERSEVALDILYPSFYSGEMPQGHYNEALEQALWFLNCGGERSEKPSPKLVDWEQDFPHIITSINRVAGCEVRELPYLHWWTFVGYYNEIGDCLFSNIVSIRKKLKTGKALDKAEREWYRENRELVEFRRVYTPNEDEILEQWMGT